MATYELEPRPRKVWVWLIAVVIPALFIGGGIGFAIGRATDTVTPWAPSQTQAEATAKTCLLAVDALQLDAPNADDFATACQRQMATND